MKIDHFEVRRAVGEAALRIAAAEVECRAARADARNAAHKRWRDLSDQAEAARAEYDRLSRLASKPIRDVAIIEAAKQKHPGLLFYEHDELDPMVCQATGLALMEGDETFGNPESGAVLKAAVELRIEPLTLQDETDETRT